MEGGATETLIHFPPLQTGLGDSPPGPVFFVVAFRSVLSLAGGLVFCQVRGHMRIGCFHYIRGLSPF